MINTIFICGGWAQSGFYYNGKGKRVLIDPYLSDSLTKKYAHRQTTLRMSERVMDPELLKIFRSLLPVTIIPIIWMLKPNACFEK
jgi:L-ascorbate metabolism protein UlaG (beta-lactamase superfamily)